MQGKTIGVAMTGSFCTFAKAFDAFTLLKKAGAKLIPIMSEAAYTMDTRFGSAESMRERLAAICASDVIHTIQQVEPIGPKGLLDLLVLAPCTGNTLAKLAGGIADSPVSMAVKSQLRNERPVLIALSSNDALGVSAVNIGILLARKHVYFVPFRQDDPVGKPRSAVADFSRLADAARSALAGRQLQPLLACD